MNRDNELLLVALVAPTPESRNRKFIVEFRELAGMEQDKKNAIFEAVQDELDGDYPIYHRGTASNLYSRVHWGYYT